MIIDCSIAAQDGRRKELQRLRARLYSGVQNISDRSRSVGYANPDAMMQAVAQLEKEIAFCAGVPRPRRLSYTPLIKGL